MRYKILLSLLISFLVSIFVFSGTIKISALVDGSDYIKIRGNSVWVEHRNYEPIRDLKYRFIPESGIPERDVNIYLKKEKGSGPVEIVEYPKADNNYTLSILVNNDNEDVYPQLYVFTVYWKEKGVYSGIDKKRFDYIHWRGNVDGRDVLIFHGGSVRVKRERGKEIESMRYTFSKFIPQRNVKVLIKKVEGRGEIKILEYPDAYNDYSIKVLVDDGPYSGRDVYDFYIYWKKESVPDSFDFFWEGKVDGADYLIIRGKSLHIRHIKAKPIRDMHYKFYAPLPEKRVKVKLFVLRGRGKVKIVEQPNFFNRYSLKILIEDNKGGDYKYKIGLKWNKRGGVLPVSSRRREAGKIRGGVIRWRGYVDGVVELRFRRKIVTSHVIRGENLRDVKVNFFKELPRKKVFVKLNRISGRGSVKILQQPTKYNDYSVVVRIIDDKFGKGYYEFELYW